MTGSAIFDESVLENGERILFALRRLYLAKGYRLYRMSKFEEYDFYAGNKDFLVSDTVITFTDTDGKLMALKPDVTLSLIKNSADEPNKTQKVFYNENVYRVSKESSSFREIMQAGVECFGNVGIREIAEVLSLAAESLQSVADGAVIAVSDLDVVSELVEKLRLGAEAQKALYGFISERNDHEICRLLADCEASDAARTLRSLISLHGSVPEVLPVLDGLLCDIKAYARFRSVITEAAAAIPSGGLTVDFSVTGDINYYNGTVFRGFVRDVPAAVLSGGQYDRLMKKLGRKSSAIGFAVYTDALERLAGKAPADAASPDEDDMPYLNIALPKGRLGEKVYDAFARAGFECPSILEQNRKLIFENAEKRVRYFWVKPSDVAIYVERGAADIGVAGKDILLEYEPDVYELFDLDKGKCRMAVAAPKGFTDDPSKALRVATKFKNVAKRHYRAKGRDIDIIHLNGSIEIAPILGLSDVIVDIVETGTTLRENDLEVIEDVFSVSARLIANKAAYKYKSARIEAVVAGLTQMTEESK